MKLRKLVSILGLTAALSLAAACGQNEGSTEQNQESTETEENGGALEAAPEDTESTEEAAGEDAAAGQQEDGAVSEAPVKISGVIKEVGEDTITVDNQSENAPSGEIILTIDPENTVIADGQTGLPVTLADVAEGSFEAYLGPAMTMSLPPHSTPYVVVVNLPEDGVAPQYAVAAEELVLEDGYYTLKATDGRTYTIPEDVEIAPFRTRNIVTLQDLTAGRACLIWLDENETAVKLILLEGTPGMPGETAQEETAQEETMQEVPAQEETAQE